jgi:hypothetical protein
MRHEIKFSVEGDNAVKVEALAAKIVHEYFNPRKAKIVDGKVTGYESDRGEPVEVHMSIETHPKVITGTYLSQGSVGASWVGHVTAYTGDWGEHPPIDDPR